jgi:hypothetical protein
VAAKTGELAFSVFTNFEFHVFGLPANPAGEVVTRATATAAGRILPPTEPNRISRVGEYLADAATGLEAPGAFKSSDAPSYRPALTLDYVGQPSFGVGADRFGNYIGGGASAYFSDMLGDRLLGVAVQAQGTLKDVGAQAFYANLSSRWNWAIAGGHIPYLQMYQNFDRTSDGQLYLGLQRLRIFVTSAQGQLAYPFSTSRRIELGAGAVRYAYDVEEDRYFLDQTGRYFTGEQERTSVNIPCESLTEDQRLLGALCVPNSLNLAQASVAYVGDNSFFGFTSPIRGGRFRFGVEGTAGTENFLTATADWRRYFSPSKNLTIAVRGLHIGRYGNIASDAIRPMFIGYETLMHGYAWESFDPDECTASQLQAPNQDSTCPTFTRLFGHRMAVANLELRIPLIGTKEFGLVNFPFVPVELAFFGDAGIAWDNNNPATFELSKSSVDRVPVFSTGAAARFNVLGFMVLEAYYAYPFQRPFKGGHFGFNISPGW